MRTLGLWVVGLAVLVTACGGNQSGAGRACTAIGSDTGIGVDIDAALAERVTLATISVCWDGNCQEPKLDLFNSTAAVSATCAPGNDPNSACSAQAVQTGAKNGFARLPQLPTKPVQVTLRLLDGPGGTVVDQRVELTPKVTYPNGPDCGAGGTQAGIKVGADGSVQPR